MAQPLLFDLLSPDRVKVPLDSVDKMGLIDELARMLASAAGVPAESETIRAAVLEREAVLSTGIGGGVAIPHGKCPTVGDLTLVAGTTRRPMNFDALDAQPIRIALMLVGPESAAALHVKVLSRIGRLLRDEAVLDRLVDSTTPREFLSVIRDAETR